MALAKPGAVKVALAKPGASKPGKAAQDLTRMATDGVRSVVVVVVVVVVVLVVVGVAPRR